MPDTSDGCTKGLKGILVCNYILLYGREQNQINLYIPDTF